VNVLPHLAVLLLLLLMVAPCWSVPARALEVDLGGQVRMAGDLSYYDADTVIARTAGNSALPDGAASLRLNSRTAFNDRLSFTLHYEAVAAGGDNRRALAECGLTELYGGGVPEDERRLFDLTHTIRARDGGVIYHRLDRLHLDCTLPRGLLRLGRQALSWGNGLLFNPADLVNPFSPADVVRDYKIGTDMLLLQTWGGCFSDLQLVLVPRREAPDGEFSPDCSSVAARVRLPRGALELDLMLAYHYDALVAGAGMSGFLGAAAWRTDITWTAGAAGGPERFLAVVANLDYSWVWGGMNWYGFVEGYYHGGGEADAEKALTDPWIAELYERGEMYLAGRHYLAGHVGCEVHPLVNLMATVIGNLDDASLICQPRLNWDLTRSLDLLLGADIPLGGRGDEFGSRRLPWPAAAVGRQGGNKIAMPSRVYLQITRYF
jgi:hypothetical protein